MTALSLNQVQRLKLFGGAEMGTWERTLGCFFKKVCPPPPPPLLDRADEWAPLEKATVAGTLATLNCTGTINWDKAEPGLLAQPTKADCLMRDRLFIH